MSNTSRNVTMLNMKAIYVIPKDNILVVWEKYRLWERDHSRTDLLSAQGVWLWHRHMQWELRQISLTIRDCGFWKDIISAASSPAVSTIDPQVPPRNITWSPKTPYEVFYYTHRNIDWCGRSSKISTCTLMSIRLSNMCSDRRWLDEKVSLAQAGYLICYNSTTNCFRKRHAPGFVRR